MNKSFLTIISVFLLITACEKKESSEGKLGKAEKQEVMENKSNRVSPSVTATDTIGGNAITINYGSPMVKGRTIWGGLVPYDTIWRTGANEATTIEFSEDVLVNGQLLKKDIYALFSIPGKEEWQIIFSLNETQWGSFKYREADDALRIKTKPMVSDTLLESLTFYILPDELNANAATIKLGWEKLEVAFSVENTSSAK